MYLAIMTEIPLHISIIFAVITMITIAWFHVAMNSMKLLVIVLSWLVLQSFLGWSGFFEDTESIPPRIMAIGILPCFIAMIIAFKTNRGRALMDRMNLKTITWMSTIRIPVEIILTMLFHGGLVSVLMSWEGTNWDIFSGITAPIVALIAFRSGTVKRKLLLGWNILCLALLLNVVVTAALAFPSPFQQLAFDQPNIGILMFPMNLLPSVVVPIVIFSHLASIRRLWKA
jgi:hypothetical protein